MNAFALCVSLVLASNGTGKQMVRQQPGALVTSPAISAVANFPFSSTGCVANGGTIGTRGETASVTRASSASYLDAAGTMQSCASGSARVGCEAKDATACGLLVEPDRSNYALYSENVATGTGWTTFGTLSLTADACADMAGANTLDRIQITNGSRYRASTLPSSWTATASATIRATTGTSTVNFEADCPGGNTIASCTCKRSDGTACAAVTISTNTCYVPVAATTTPVRVMLTRTCANAAATSFTVAFGYGSAADVCVGQVQEEPGPYATSYVGPVAGTAVERFADVITSSWPSSAKSAWCVRATVTPTLGRAWNAADAYLWSSGTSAAANSARLLASSSGTLVFDVYDGAGAAKTATYTHGFTAGSKHTITACDVGGTLSMFVDAAVVTPTITGAGTGTWSAAPSTLYFGTLSAAGTEAAGVSGSVKVCKSSQGCL